MDKIAVFIIRGLLLFLRNIVGCVNSPYTAFRSLSQKEDNIFQTVFIFLLVIFYFIFASLLRVGVRNPFLLTVKFNTLFLGAVIGFLSLVLVIYYFGKLSGGKGKLNTIFTLWSFTLLPTLIWFLATSLLYIFLPPPRTLTILGKLYSIAFIAFSLSIFFWKLILFYLTLRFGHKLDFFKIILVSLAVSLFIALYSLVMYRWGVFRIPFI